MTALLTVKELQAFYGPSRALHGLDFGVEQGGITTILGANGAGKTTTLRALCGRVTARGEVWFDGVRIDRRPTAWIVRQGVALVPEGRGTFAQLSVEENLKLGAYCHHDRAEVAADFERSYRLFPVLAERRRQQAGTLSGGEQQMLAIARALMLRPRLLILDEPSFGLAPQIVARIFDLLRQLNDEDGLSLLLVEQNATLALDLADQAYLLETGRFALSGPAAELKADAAIRRAYLGY